ncbi:17711_t:CDS:2, partial [Cetraspora pellucida]
LGEILYGRSCDDSYTTIAKNAKKWSGRKPIFGALKLDELKRMVIQDTKHRHLSAQEIKDLWNKEKNQSVSIFLASHNIRVWHTPAEEFDESKVNGEVYVKLIRRHALRAVRRLVPNSQVKAAFSRAGIPILSWPAQSPDLNPIENMWQEVERHLQNSPDKPTSIDDLEKKVIAAWYSIPRKFYCGLVNSVVHR